MVAVKVAFAERHTGMAGNAINHAKVKEEIG